MGASDEATVEMLDWLGFRYRLWRLERERRSAEKAGKKTIDAMKKAGVKGDDLDEAEYGVFMDEVYFEDRVYGEHTRYLLRVAHRLIVPIPSYSDEENWEDSNYDGMRYLVPGAIHKLRTAIRAEQKLRRETILMWLPAIGAITGLLGVIIGLVAVWHGTPTTPH